MTPETYTIDGVVFDLSRTWGDCLGVEWRWTGARNAQGEPLMTSEAGLPSVPLPDVYHDHGPLIPMPEPRTQQAARRNWLHDAVMGGAW